jgi:hypothetical protein
MEEKLSDKEMRDKLQAAEYPFDPQAWGQMEAMLDKKDKRRALLFWWSSGIAAALLVAGLSTYMLLHQQGSTNANGTQAAYTQTTNTDKTTDTPDQKIEPAIAEAQTTSNQTIHTTTEAINEPLSPKTKTTKGSSTNPQGGALPIASALTHKKAKHNLSTTHKHKAKEVISPTETIIATTATPAPSKELLSNKVKEQSELNTLPALGLSEIDIENERTLVGDKSESLYKLPKKKIGFHYLIGIEAGASAGYIHSTLADLPSWSIGLTHEFKIGKYIGITNSILYSETNFKIDSPGYPDYASAYPISYTSHIKEITIPIGVKVYPYNNAKLSWYVSASYVNHIRLQESFAYNLVTNNRLNTSANPGTDMITSDEYQKIVDFGASLLATPNQNKTAADYFSLGNSKTYYGGMTFSTGIDYHITSRIQFSAEPFFGMSLTKVTLQNSRLYNFGGNVRLMYRF